jgi:hypothetical protein
VIALSRIPQDRASESPGNVRFTSDLPRKPGSFAGRSLVKRVVGVTA